MSAAGTWKLEVNTPLGKRTPTLIVNDDGSGEFQSPDGNANLSEGKLDGDSISAKTTLKMMGQEIKAEIEGKADGDSISGQVKTPMGNASFTGTRA